MVDTKVPTIIFMFFGESEEVIRQNSILFEIGNANRK